MITCQMRIGTSVAGMINENDNKLIDDYLLMENQNRLNDNQLLFEKTNTVNYDCSYLLNETKNVE